ncbi:THO complex subunit 2, partial [Coemansia sp. RSA 518]
FQQQWRYDRGFLPPKSRTILSPSPPEGSGDERRIKPGTTMLSYEDFRTVMRKWQVNLTKAFIVTLESERHDTVRNSILALKEMRKSFPIILQYGRRIMDKVNEVAAGRTSGQGSTNNPDSDKNLKVLAASYSAFLGSAKQTWIPESKYYSMPVRATPARSPHPTPTQPPTRQISLTVLQRVMRSPGQTAAKECEDQGPAGLARATKQWLLWQRQLRLLLVHQGLYPEDLVGQAIRAPNHLHAHQSRKDKVATKEWHAAVHQKVAAITNKTEHKNVMAAGAVVEI